MKDKDLAKVYKTLKKDGEKGKMGRKKFGGKGKAQTIMHCRQRLLRRRPRRRLQPLHRGGIIGIKVHNLMLAQPVQQGSVGRAPQGMHLVRRLELVSGAVNPDTS
jgi:hypothetical protein